MLGAASMVQQAAIGSSGRRLFAASDDQGADSLTQHIVPDGRPLPVTMRPELGRPSTFARTPEFLKWHRHRPTIHFNGAQGRNRTTDTAIFSRMLYQLSYLGTSLAAGAWERGFIVRLGSPVHHASPSASRGAAMRQPCGNACLAWPARRRRALLGRTD